MQGSLSISRVAERAGVHVATVRLWADSGQLPHSRTLGGHRRFREADVDALLEQMQASGHKGMPTTRSA